MTTTGSSVEQLPQAYRACPPPADGAPVRPATSRHRCVTNTAPVVTFRASCSCSSLPPHSCDHAYGQTGSPAAPTTHGMLAPSVETDCAAKIGGSPSLGAQGVAA